MLLAGILLAASLTVQGALGHRQGHSVFLEPRVCLGFDILCNVTDYEARSYNQTVWVAVRKDPLFGFSRRSLFEYVQGSNSQGMSLKMTAQFLVAHDADGPLVLYWLLPADLQANPPQPLADSHVFLANFSKMYVYAKTVRARFRELRHESKTFNITLTEDNVNHNQSISYSAFCKRGRGRSGRRTRDAEPAEQQLDAELFSPELENSGDGPLPVPLEHHGELRRKAQWGRPGSKKRHRKGRRSRCFDIWFLSNEFPVCPIP